MNGGAAFPVQADYIRGDKPGTYEFLVKHQPGMTLRDYFASHASEEDIEDHRTKAWVDDSKIDGHWEYTNSREDAKYAYADAMLAARKETDNG